MEGSGVGFRFRVPQDAIKGIGKMCISLWQQVVADYKSTAEFCGCYSVVIALNKSGSNQNHICNTFYFMMQRSLF